jgi:hypothetical protein
MAITLPLSADNYNVFGRSFGIEFGLTNDDVTKMAVHQVAPFEHTSMFGKQRIWRKSWPIKSTGPSWLMGFPANSLTAIVNCIFEILLLLRNSSTNVSNVSAPDFRLDAPVDYTRSRQSSGSTSLIFNTVIGAVLLNAQAWT